MWPPHLSVEVSTGFELRPDRIRRHQRELQEHVRRCTTESHAEASGHGFPGYSPFTNVTRELRWRELGDRRHRVDKIWPSMLRNDNRELRVSTEFRTLGQSWIDCKRVVSNAGVVELEEEESREFAHDQHDRMKVKQILQIDSEQLALSQSYLKFDDHARELMEKYVIVLTDLGQVRFYRESGNDYVMAYRFNLPVHLFDFRSIEWNVNRDEVYVIGVANRRHIDEISDDQFSHNNARANSSVFNRSHAVAMFSMKGRVELKFLIKLEPHTFGVLNSVFIHADNLICVNPKRTDLYNLDRLIEECCMDIAPPERIEGNPESDRIVPFTLVVQKRPVAAKVFHGGYNELDISVSSMHVLRGTGNGISSGLKVERLRDGKEPIRVSEWEGRSTRINIRSSSTRFHPEETNRLIRFEGEHVRCFTIMSSAKEYSSYKKEKSIPPSSMELQWSVRLIPQAIQRYNTGEAMPHQLPNIVHSMKYVHGNILMITMLYDANVVSPIEDFLYCPVLILLDALTGKTIRVESIGQSIFYQDDSIEMGAAALYALGRREQTDGHSLLIYRLMEKVEREEIPKSGKGVPNRKEKRQKRKAEERERRRREREGEGVVSLIPGGGIIV